MCVLTKPTILSLSYLEEIGFFRILSDHPPYLLFFAVAIIRLFIALLAMLCYYCVALLLLSKYSSQTIKIQFYIFNVGFYIYAISAAK